MPRPVPHTRAGMLRRALARAFARRRLDRGADDARDADADADAGGGARGGARGDGGCGVTIERSESDAPTTSTASEDSRSTLGRLFGARNVGGVVGDRARARRGWKRAREGDGGGGGEEDGGPAARASGVFAAAKRAWDAVAKSGRSTSSRRTRTVSRREAAIEASVEAARRARDWDASSAETSDDASDEHGYVEDDYEKPPRLVEIAEETLMCDASEVGAAARLVAPSSCSYGLRCARDIDEGTTVLELHGLTELITAQRCARTPALKELARYWTLVQASSAVRTLVAREDLRTWRRNGSLHALAPWAQPEDFEGEGYVLNPVSDTLHLGLDETLLCCFIALERKKGASSSWSDYLSKLPMLDDFSSYVPAVMPIHKLIRLLGHEDCKNAYTYQPKSDADLRWMLTEARRLQRLVELTHRHIVSKVVFDGASANSYLSGRTTISLDEFRWAHACVLTRAFQSPNDPSKDPWADMYKRMDFTGAYLAPVLDFANHRRPREVAYETTEGDNGHGKVIVTSLRSFQKGEFIHITYGAKGNSELFLRYGFCVSRNVEPDGSSNDKIRVDKDDFRRYLQSYEENDARQGEDVLLQVAATVDYMYKSFAQLLEVALAHYSGSEATDDDVSGVDELPVRDDRVWDVDEDVFGVDLDVESAIEDDADTDEANLLMYGGEEDADVPAPNERARDDDIRDVRTRREIQAAVALFEYLGSLDEDVDARWRSAAKEPDARRAYLVAQYKTWRASRRRALDVFAHAAHLRARRLLDSMRARDRALADADVSPSRASRAVARRLADDTDALDAALALADARDAVFEISLADHALG